MKKENEIPKPKGVYPKLLAIQESVMGLQKDKQGTNYSYVTGDKVLSHIKPLMNEYGLLLKQEVVSIENTRQDYIVGVNRDNPTGRGKSEILSKVMQRFTWIDAETGEKDVNEFGANGQNDWDKGVGSALTYAERYFLLKYFHIATDQDDIDNRQGEDAGFDSPEDVAIGNIRLCVTLEDLQTLWVSLPANIKANKQVLSTKDARKEQLTKK